MIKVTQWKMVADGKPNEWAGIVGLTRYFLRDWDFLRDWATSVLQLFATMERMRLDVRQANLDEDLRYLFEQYGEQVVAMALALGSSQGTGLRTHPVAPTHAMNVVHAHQDAAAQWLRERRDLSERRETIALILNVALLVFVSLTVFLGVVDLFRGRH